MKEKETDINAYPTSVRLPEDLRKKIAAIAKKEQRSINNMIIVALTDYVSRYKLK